MIKLRLSILVGLLLLLTGCARHYVIVKTNGDRVSVPSRPKYVDGYYYYKDESGQNTRIFASRVREIAPANMVSDPTAGFKPVHSP
jgi:hypothetical protein